MYKLVKSALITKGAKMFTILDSEANTIYRFSNDYMEILNNPNMLTLKEAYTYYNNSGDENYIDFLVFLNDRDLLFESEIDNYLDLSTEFDYPAHITNAYLEFNPGKLMKYVDLFYQLNTLFCYNINIVSKMEISQEVLSNFLEICNLNIFHSVEVTMPFSPEHEYYSLLSICNKYSFLNSITLYSASVNEIFKTEKGCNIIYLRQSLADEACGKIGAHYFALNLKHYTESIHFNTCLNRKISIDFDFNIKNCIYLDEIYGNALTDSLKDIVSRSEFTFLWGISKNLIEVCKDCEFRHVCTDCRRFIKDRNNIYSKPQKCTYNPYLGD